MSLVCIIAAMFLFAAGACADFGWLSMTSTHALGYALLGLAAFAAAHLPWGNYFR